MEHKELQDRLDQAGMRIDRIVHLAAIGTDALGYENEDFLFGHECEDLFKQWGIDELIREMTDAREGRLSIREEVMYTLYHKNLLGWILEVAKPVGTYMIDPEEWAKQNPEGAFQPYMSSWGHHHVERVYGDTYEEALEAAFAWADEQKPEWRGKQEIGFHEIPVGDEDE